LKESVIQASIVAYLKTIKLGYVLNVSTTGIFDPIKKQFRTNKNQKGTSDILFFNRGKCTAIEVKTAIEYKFVMKHYERLKNISLCKTSRDKHLHDQILFIEGLKRSGNAGFFSFSIHDTKMKLMGFER